MLYRWVVFLHVVGVFGFLVAHGASAILGFTLPHERSPERIRALLDLSAASRALMYWSLALLLVAGITAGFMGHWWGSGWIWAALALLTLIVMLVVVIGVGYFRELRLAVAPPVEDAAGEVTTSRIRDEADEADETDEALAALLASPRPRIISVTGSVLLVLILYLMMFKPF